MEIDIPDRHDIDQARDAFEENESRDLFYRVAIELVEFVLQGLSSLTLAEAVSVLLQTWNRAYYRFRKFDAQHFDDISDLITNHQNSLVDLRKRSIDSLSSEDEVTIPSMFQEFEIVLGPVGASKCLHLLAPNFFPLWDRAIAEAYRCSLSRAGENGTNYYRFMLITMATARSLGGDKELGRNVLKAIDEYNYCKYTKHWI